MRWLRWLWWRPRPHVPPPVLLTIVFLTVAGALTLALDRRPRLVLDGVNLIHEPSRGIPQGMNIPHLAFSADGRRLLTRRGQNVCCIDTGTGRIIGRLPLHDRLCDVTEAIFESDGKVLAIRQRLGSLGFECIRWDPATEQVDVLKRESRRATMGRISPDARWLILTMTEQGKKRTLVHDVPQRKDMLTLEEPNLNAATTLFAQGDTLVHVVEQGAKLIVLDPAGQERGQVAAPADFGNLTGADVQFSYDAGTMLVTWRGVQKNAFALVETNPLRERLRRVVELPKTDSAWAFLQEGPCQGRPGWVLADNFLNVGSVLQVFDGEDRPVGDKLRFTQMSVLSCRLLAGGTRLAVAGNVFPKHTPWWYRLREAPTKVVPFADPHHPYYAEAQVIDLPSGSRRFRWRGETRDPRQLTISADGQLLARATPEQVELWDVPTPLPWLRVLGGALGATLLVAFALVVGPRLWRGARRGKRRPPIT